MLRHLIVPTVIFIGAFVLTLVLYLVATELYPRVNYFVCYLRQLAGIPSCLVPIPL